MRLDESVKQLRHDLGSGTLAIGPNLGFADDVTIEVFRADTALLSVYEQRNSVRAIQLCEHCAKPLNDMFEYRDRHAEPKSIAIPVDTLTWLGAPPFSHAAPTAPPHWISSRETFAGSLVSTLAYRRDGAPFVALRMFCPPLGYILLVERLAK